MSRQYKVVNGTFYGAKTSDKVISILERCRRENIRVTLDYGDIKTGCSWGEVCDISGTIGRSCGDIKIPLLIHNIRSMGGGGIPTDCIIGIKESRGGLALYRHKPYQTEMDHNYHTMYINKELSKLYVDGRRWAMINRKKTEYGYYLTSISTYICVWKTKLVINSNGTAKAHVLKKMNYRAPERHTLYFDAFGQLISETQTDGRTDRQVYNSLNK